MKFRVNPIVLSRVGITALMFIFLIHEALVAAPKSRNLPEVLILEELGIPLIYQKAEGSELFQFSIGIDTGYARVAIPLKRAGSVMTGTMTMATEDFPKEKLFELRERLSIGLGCNWGLINSICGVNTVNENWKTALQVLASSLLRPSFTDRDMTLVQERTVASLKSEMSSPASVVNDEINRIYYGTQHPYFVPASSELEYLSATKRSDLIGLHGEMLKSSKLYFAVVTSLEKNEVKATVLELFSKLPRRPQISTKIEKVSVKLPVYSEGEPVAVKGLDIPSAYISVKFNSVSQSDPRFSAATLMYEIMAKELFEEIRTKRSLSYSVHSRLLAADIGIGIVTASTSKPQETLDALANYLKDFRDRDWAKVDIDQYKMAFTTQYFLSQEGHEELASTLLATYMTYGSFERFLNFTKLIAGVTKSEIAEVAKFSLKNLKVAVVFDEKKVKKEWLSSFVKNF